MANLSLKQIKALHEVTLMASQWKGSLYGGPPEAVAKHEELIATAYEAVAQLRIDRAARTKVRRLEPFNEAHWST